jgi:hypothetical protein
MAPPVDAFSNLQRCCALRQAGRDLPRDLDDWLTNALTAIARGAPPADVFGLKAQPSRRRPTTRERYRQRDAAIVELFALATGSQEGRAELVLEWSDGSRPPPPDAAPLLEEIEATGLPVPDVRRLVEIATSSPARCVTAPADSATLATSE